MSTALPRSLTGLALAVCVVGGSIPAFADTAVSWAAVSDSARPGRTEPGPWSDKAPEADDAPPPSPVSFGRALDLQGSPLRLVPPKRSATSGASRGRATLASGPFNARLLPLRGGGISSGFGWRRHPISGGHKFHSGIDLAAPSGTPIVATAAGTVASADWYGGYGLCVTVDHGNGYVTLYGHMSRITVSAGQAVQPGQTLGLVGSTGSSTGPHLHYELRRDGYAVNPGIR